MAVVLNVCYLCHILRCRLQDVPYIRRHSALLLVCRSAACGLCFVHRLCVFILGTFLFVAVRLFPKGIYRRTRDSVGFDYLRAASVGSACVGEDGLRRVNRHV